MGGEGKRHETPHLRKQLRFTSHLGAYRTFKPLFLPAATNFKSVVSGLFEQGAQVASGETAMFCRTRGTLRWFCFGKVMLLCWGQEEAEYGWQKHSVEFADLMIFMGLMGI